VLRESQGAADIMVVLRALVLVALIAGHSHHPKHYHRRSTFAQTVQREAEASPMVLCIEWRESTSTPRHLRPWAANGSQTGIAQWDEAAWVEDKGLRYASTPTGATGVQQEAVLVWSIDHGLAGEWQPYDGC
jgi:hypothetical protein